MIAITTFFGRQIEVKETDEIYYTELNAMLDSKRWGTGLRKHLPVNVWISEPPRPFEDDDLPTV